MTAELLRWLLSSTTLSSMAIVLVLLLRKPVRMRFGAHTAYLLWALVPCAVLGTLMPAPVNPLVSPVMPALIMHTTAMAATSGDAAPKPSNPQAWLIAIWLSGAISMLLLQVAQQCRFTRALGRLTAEGNGLMRARTGAPGCPALLGVWRPLIVLPVDFERRYDALERELILTHERVHRSRGDAQFNALAALMRCVYWFNPLLHLGVSRFRFDQELACDASVIARNPDSCRRYAGAMLKTQLADLGLPAGCHWQSSQPLKERIVMLKQPLPGRVTRRWGMSFIATVIVLSTLTAWAIQPQRNAPSTSAAASGDAPAKGKRFTATIAYRRLKPMPYPSAAIADGVQGVVYVRVNVAPDGSVSNAELDHVDPASATVLVGPAVEGVKTWTFNPARVAGKPVAALATIPVVFSLRRKHDSKATGADLQAIIITPPAANSAQR